jgi:hypothetical protein
MMIDDRPNFMRFVGISSHAIRACAMGLGCALSILFSSIGYGEETASLGRPDLMGAKPQAACEVQVLTAAPRQVMPEGVVFISAVAPMAEDPLSNYARSPLGDWQMPEDVDRAEPWLRLVLFAVRRPVVIDLAVFVDGKPYADAREAWIDGVLDQSATDVASVASTAVGETVATKKSIVPAANEPPKVSAQARQAPSMRERLLSYVLQPGPAVKRTEIRWLIAESGFGPPVVVLDTSLSWQRAGVAPLVALLDADRSGALEAAEIAGAIDVLEKCDADANDVVEEQELLRKTDASPVMPFAVDHPLVVLLNDATDRDSLVAELGRVYGLDAAAAESELSGPADVTLRADFGKGAGKQGVAVLATGLEVAGTTANAIALDLGAEVLEFSAAETAKSDATDGEAGIGRTQIAVGAAVDGNPLLRILDADGDHRMTRRERRQLPAMLASLDRDGDGTVAGVELPIPIRFAVTVGPNVHTLLATPSGAVRKLAPTETAPAAPDWFVSMDANGDGDLSPEEFLGTPEQFRQFDADGDGLLNVTEAAKMGTGE